MNRNEQITALLPFARQKTKSFMSRRGIPPTYLDEIQSDSFLALIKAVDAHDSSRGPLKPYAERRIEGEILDGIRSRTGIRSEIREGELVLVQKTRSALTALSLSEPTDGWVDPVEENDGIEEAENRLTLDSILSQLSPEDRSLLIDRYIHNLGVCEMARQRGSNRYYTQKALDKAVERAQRLAQQRTAA
jgi:RNA polymerase sigma factor (sigma-70 family)